MVDGSLKLRDHPGDMVRDGLLHGQVLNVSQDAVIRDRKQDHSENRELGTQNDTSEPQGQELNYTARRSIYRLAWRPLWKSRPDHARS
jgi:hypothetical protein